MYNKYCNNGIISITQKQINSRVKKFKPKNINFCKRDIRNQDMIAKADIELLE